MKLFGKVIAFIARFLLYRDCQKLKAELVRIYSEYGQSMKQDISPRFSDFFIVAEDRRFSTHSGIDVIAVIRTIWKYLLYRQLSGASTIQQQLVRTIQRRYERSFRRKIREMMLACVVSEVMEKYEILDSYLHVAQFGFKKTGKQKHNFVSRRNSRCNRSTLASQLKNLLITTRCRNYSNPLDLQ